MTWRAAALGLLVSACASPALPKTDPLPPPPSATPPPPEPTPSPQRVEHPEVLYTGARATRLARLAGIARGLYDAYGNERPQPVTRGFAQVQFVQFATDRRDRGVFSWVEASTTALHGAPDVAEHVEPCATPIPIGEEARLVRGRAKLVRTDDHDELFVAESKGDFRVAKLPRGASRGACAGPDGSRVWISWSTPDGPAELWSVSLRDGTTRALRKDARPGTGGLGDVKSGALTIEGRVAAFLEPNLAAKHAALLVADTPEPLATWDALARTLAEAGVAVLLARAPTAAALETARKRWGAPVVTIARALPASTPAEAPLVLLARPEDAKTAASLAGGSLVIGIGDASREPLLEALGRTSSDLRFAIAGGGSPRISVAAAWAVAADAALGEP